MKCSVFAVLAMLAMAGALTEARQLQSTTPAPTPSKPSINWGALASKFLPYVAATPAIPIYKFQASVPVVKPSVTYKPTTVVLKHPTPAPVATKPTATKPKTPVAAPKPAAPKPAVKPVPVFIPAKFLQGQAILTAIFLKARPQIAAVIKHGGVPVMDSAIANALFGNADAMSAADAKNFVGPAKAMSDAVAQAVWGDAEASAAAKSATKLGNTKAISAALANAINGMAKSTSTAEGKTMFGMGATISEAQADAICGPAWALSTSKCTTELGGCEAVSNAIALAFKGQADATSVVTAACGTLSMKGQPCKATGNAQALSIKGDANAKSSSSAENAGLPAVLAAKLFAKLENKL